MLGKKGISQQVALVLLVGLTIALLVLAFLWGKHYLEERAIKQGKIAEAKLECESIDISITQAYQQGPNAVIVVKNKKDIKIPKLTFRFEGVDIDPRETFEVLNNLEVKKYKLLFGEGDINKLEKITVVPWLKVAFGYYIPCNKQQKTTSFLTY